MFRTYKMDYFLNNTISGVSLDLETSWAAKSLKEALNNVKYDVCIVFDYKHSSYFFYKYVQF